jgi:hypothetical protein
VLQETRCWLLSILNLITECLKAALIPSTAKLFTLGYMWKLHQTWSSLRAWQVGTKWSEIVWLVPERRPHTLSQKLLPFLIVQGSQLKSPKTRVSIKGLDRIIYGFHWKANDFFYRSRFCYDLQSCARIKQLTEKVCTCYRKLQQQEDVRLCDCDNHLVNWFQRISDLQMNMIPAASATLWLPYVCTGGLKSMLWFEL